MYGINLPFALIIVFLIWTVLKSQTVQAYNTYFAAGKLGSSEQSYIVIRKFSYHDKINYLAVNPDSLSTTIFSNEKLIITNESWTDILNQFSHTAYIRVLDEASQNADAIQDAGLTHFSSIEKGANLSIDLCPSNKPLDRTLFTGLINDFSKEEMPVPVAISVTGVWMNKHASDLDWLKALVHKNEVSITWVNHSYNHNYTNTLPLKENFLLERGTDLNFEVLQTEIKMIENDLLPSIFFRFPGLVSDEETFKKIIGFGLIPIGSDAWLGKNQWPKDGSIILLHGNGNEPVGIKRFFKLLKDEKNEIRKKQWLLYDLRESVKNFAEPGQRHD